jgi:hypothetical protein
MGPAPSCRKLIHSPQRCRHLCALRRGPIPCPSRRRPQRPEVERCPDEVTQRDHQFGGVDRPPRSHIARGLARKAHVFFGAEQDDVRQRRLHGVANSPRAVRARRLGALFAQFLQVRWIDGKLPGERAAQRLVSRDQRPQPLVDLPVHALAPLLYGLHHQHTDADADQGKDRKTEQRGEHAIPGTEIEISHSPSLSLCRKV